MFLFALMLQGCGKKGPLYLPKPQPEQAASQDSATQPTPSK
ncbi:MAG TPA: lipoprotein [Gallionellaceae bacterium]